MCFWDRRHCLHYDVKIVSIRDSYTSTNYRKCFALFNVVLFYAFNRWKLLIILPYNRDKVKRNSNTKTGLHCFCEYRRQYLLNSGLFLFCSLLSYFIDSISIVELSLSTIYNTRERKNSSWTRRRSLLQSRF